MKPVALGARTSSKDVPRSCAVPLGDMGSKLSKKAASGAGGRDMSKRPVAPTSSQGSEKKRLSMKHEVADKLEVAAAEVGRKQALLDQATQRASAAQDGLEQLESEWPEEYKQLLLLLKEELQAKQGQEEELLTAVRNDLKPFTKDSGARRLASRWREERAKVDKLAAAEERANAAWLEEKRGLTALQSQVTTVRTGGRRDSPPPSIPHASDVVFSCNHLAELVPEFQFEYRADEVFDGMCQALDDSLGSLFRGARHPSGAQFPMIKGAAGSGKTRMGVEVALHGISVLEREGKKAVHLFIPLNQQDHLQVAAGDMKDNRPLQERVMVGWLLLGLLGRATFDALKFERILLEFEEILQEWTLSAVLRRVKQELNVDLVFVHIDEYKHDMAATFAMFKACERSYSAGLLANSASLHLIVSGITTRETDGRNDIESLGISGNASVRRVVLSGVRTVPGLDEEVARALDISASALKQCVNFRRVLTDCGGLARCFEFVVDVLKAAPAMRDKISQGSMSQDEGRHLFKQIRIKLGERYGEKVWLRVFFNDNKDEAHLLRNAYLCMRRVLYIAVAGSQVEPYARVLPELSATFDAAQDSGLFALTATRQVSMPLVAVALFNEWTAKAGVVPAFTDSELDPFTYDWDSFEDMALASLRARMNAAFYLRGPCKLGLRELRPGALLSDAATLQEDTLIFDVPAEVPPTSLLFEAAETAGFADRRKTGPGGNGERVTLKVMPGAAPGVVKTAPNQAALDGGVASSTCLVWSQSKSRDVASAGTRSLGPAEVATIAAKMLVIHDKVLDKSNTVDTPGPVVLDVLTARVKAKNFRGEAGASSNVDSAMLSRINGTPLVITTDDCIEECLGPVFAVRIRMLRRFTAE